MRGNGHVTEDVTNGGRKVMSEVVSLMEGDSHVLEVACLMKGEWFCYKGGLFNEGQMAVLERRPV